MLRMIFVAFALFVAGACFQQPVFARSMESGDAVVARKATPAVVNISTGKVKAPEKPTDSARRVKTYGSGFVIDPSGIIVTNKHVIDGALDVKVVFSNGDRVSARLIAAAAMLDLALLKVDVGHPLPTLEWGNSDTLQVGDPVLTIGNQLNVGLSVAAGIVSGLNRDLQDSAFDSYIQTDAAINHGNSGGPLVDGEGKVVGVDTALFNPEENGGFIGIGFAIPSDTARYVTKILLDPQHPMPGWLGVTFQDMTEELTHALGFKPRVPVNGAIISAVDPSGPGAQIGLRPGDVLETINGEAWPDARAFMRAIVMTRVGQKAVLTIWRDGAEKEITATVAEWPNLMPNGGMMSGKMADMMIASAPDPGVRLAAITDADRKKYSLDPKLAGVLVASVQKDCEARDLGIVAGDVLTAVQGVPVTSPEDVRRAVQDAHAQHRSYLAILVQSKTSARWLSLSIGAAGS
jgi:serine protease Do